MSLIGTSAPPAPSTIKFSFTPISATLNLVEFDRHSGSSAPPDAAKPAERSGKFPAAVLRAEVLPCELHGAAVGPFARSRLDRLPVVGVERGAEQSGDDCLADSGVGSGDEETLRHVRRCRPVELTARDYGHRARPLPRQARRMSSSDAGSSAKTQTRALPAGTVGGRMARTANPLRCSSRRHVQRRFRCCPRITGTMCVALVPQSNPRAASSSRSATAISRRCARSASGLASQRKRGLNLARKIRRHRGAENKRARAIDEIFLQRVPRRRRMPLRWPALFRRCGRRRESRARTHVRPRFLARAGRRLRSRALRRAQCAAPYFARQPKQVIDWNDIALHAEYGFGDDHFRAFDLPRVRAARFPEKLISQCG